VTEPFYFSTTEAQEFRRCRRRWNFASLNRMGVEPKRRAVALDFGIGMHFALAKFYGEGLSPAAVWMDWTEQFIQGQRAELGQVWQEEEEKWVERQALGKGMLTHYESWAKENDDFEIVQVEQEFEVLLETPEGVEFLAYLIGRFDGVVRDRLGRLLLLEHKSSAYALDPAILVLDDQTLKYQMAAEKKFGIRLEGVYFNVLRKAVPREPELVYVGTKNERLTVRKDIDTTHQVYMNTIKKHDFDPTDYKEVLEGLAIKGNTFFYRETIRRNTHELELEKRRTFLNAQEMADPNLNIYPNPTWDCVWDCDFRDLCLAMNEGGDVEFLLRENYQLRKHEGVYLQSRSDPERFLDAEPWRVQ